MVDAIGMTTLIPPAIAYSPDENNTGYTGFVGLTSSHISFHHWDCLVPGVLQYDVFSAKRFDCETVLESIVDFWRCRILTTTLLDRGDSVSLRDLRQPKDRATIKPVRAMNTMRL